MTLKTRAADLATQAIELLDAQINLLSIRDCQKSKPKRIVTITIV